MTPEEFINKHFHVITEAIGAYRHKMEDHAETMVLLTKGEASPGLNLYQQMYSDFFAKEQAGKSAADDLYRLGMKMGKY